MLQSSNKSRLKKECDRLWKQIILRNCQNKCFVCGSDYLIDPHHFIPRRISLSLRYDIKNGICLCRKCHTALHWKSDSFIPLLIAFKKGKKWVRYLEKKKKEKVVVTIKWLEEQIKRLKKQ